MDRSFVQEIQVRIDNKTKPIGACGQLEKVVQFYNKMADFESAGVTV